MTNSTDASTARDEREIHRQLLRYCRAIDRGDADLLRTVYHPDALDHHGPFTGTVEDVVDQILPALAAKYHATTHYLSNVLIEIDGDMAGVESYVHASHLLTRDGALCNWVFSGRYIDRFERREGHWKIARRVTVCDWEYLLRTDGATLAPGAFPGGAAAPDDPAYCRD